MYETQQYQRANNKMEVDQSNSLVSRKSKRKSKIYQHQDPSKLNYYARFSPNRKKVNEQFISDILYSLPPLTTRSNRSSSSSKNLKQKSSSTVFKDQEQKNDKITLQEIDESLLLSMNKNNENRGEIYIDQDQELQQDQTKKQQQYIGLHIKQRERSIANTNYFNNQSQLNSKEKQAIVQSESNESSQFQRMIQPSSSDDNEGGFAQETSKKGNEMLICDEDFEQQEQASQMVEQKQFSIDGSNNLHFIDGSDKRILDLAKNIGAFRKEISNKFQLKEKQQGKKQINSENVSFSLDSDLSIIQQKWNSYFQVDDQQSQKQFQNSGQPLWLESYTQKIRQQKVHNINDERQKSNSSSSSEQLPAFSTPDTSTYQQLESYQSPNNQQSAYHSHNERINQEIQAKQFKRQYTFGNQLVTALSSYQNHQDQKIYQKQQSFTANQPLFKKLLPKSVLQKFIIEKRQKNQNNFKSKRRQNTDKLLKKQNKQKNKFLKTHANTSTAKYQSKSAHNQLIFNQKTKQLESQIMQKAQKSQSNINFLYQSIKLEEIGQDKTNEIKIEEGQQQIYQIGNSQESKFQVKNLPKKEEMFNVNTRDIFMNNKSQQVKKQKAAKIEQNLFSSKKKFQKAKRHQVWKKTIMTMLEKQRKAKIKEDQIQLLESVQAKSENSLEKQKSIQYSYQQFETPLKLQFNIQEHQNEAQNEKGSYAKIHSQKRHYRSRKGSYYQEKRKSAQSQYQSSEQSKTQRNQEYLFKKTDQQSLTTTQQVNVYPQHLISEEARIQTRKYNQDVQNMKKYLKKMNEIKVSSNYQQSGEEKLQDKWIGNLSLPVQNSIHYSSQLDKKKQHFTIKQQKQQPTIINAQIIFKSIQTKQGLHKNQATKKDELFKQHLLQDEQQLYTNKNQQEYVQQQIIPLEKSLRMLQQLIPILPKQLEPSYEKIYTKIYQQALKYQHRFQKQNFVLSFLNQIIQGGQQKIDCQTFLSIQEAKKQKNTHASTDNNNQLNQEKNKLQIQINKHIIFSLARKIGQEYQNSI